ncbi:hypothetical protein J1N35_018897, partial [Gossypium stocksii]
IEEDEEQENFDKVVKKINLGSYLSAIYIPSSTNSNLMRICEHIEVSDVMHLKAGSWETDMVEGFLSLYDVERVL